MPRPAPFTNTPLTDAELNARTVDVIGDLDQLNGIYFPKTNLTSALNAVPGMMSKTFYVDQVNGSDTSGDGSQTAPFASVNKAIASVPSGGQVTIRFIGNYKFTSDVGVVNKRVVFEVPDNAILKPTWYQDSGNNYNILNGINCSGFVGIEFILGSGAKILLDDEGFSTTTTYGTSSFFQFIKKNRSCVGYVYVSGYNTTTNIELAGVNSSPVFMNHGNLHSSEALVLHLWSVNIVKLGNGLLTAGDGIFGLKTSQVSITDGAGNALTWNDVLGGIIKDVNGVPRNVISNLIL